MHILYDPTIFVSQRYGGISRYFAELIPRIVAMDDVRVSIHMGLYLNRYGLEKLRDRYAHFGGVRRPAIRRTHRAAQWLSGRQFVRFAWRVPFDLYHTTGFFEPGLQTDRPKVITVHDMTHFLGHWQAPGFKKAEATAAIRSADGIICVSENTRRDLIRLLEIPEDRVARIYHGAPPRHTPSPGRVIAEPYILWVGARSPYKNLLSLIEAHGRNDWLRTNFRLACFGGGGLRDDERALLDQLGTLDRLTLLPRGDDQTLANLYTHAAAFVHPSNYEGFGMTLLEAFTYGCPVLSSTGGSLPEVGGDAVLYFRPGNVGELTEKLVRILNDEALKQELIALGPERLKQFSWDRCASETVEFYRRIVGR